MTTTVHDPPGRGTSAEDGGTIWGEPLWALLPPPVPARYRVVPPDERRWRGIGAIYLWLVGFTARRAWMLALSDDPVTVTHLRDDLPGLTEEHWLAVGVLRRRLMAERDADRGESSPKVTAGRADRLSSSVTGTAPS